MRGGKGRNERVKEEYLESLVGVLAHPSEHQVRGCEEEVHLNTPRSTQPHIIFFNILFLKIF